MHQFDLSGSEYSGGSQGVDLFSEVGTCYSLMFANALDDGADAYTGKHRLAEIKSAKRFKVDGARPFGDVFDTLHPLSLAFCAVFPSGEKLFEGGYGVCVVRVEQCYYFSVSDLPATTTLHQLVNSALALCAVVNRPFDLCHGYDEMAARHLAIEALQPQLLVRTTDRFGQHLFA